MEPSVTKRVGECHTASESKISEILSHCRPTLFMTAIHLFAIFYTE